VCACVCVCVCVCAWAWVDLHAPAMKCMHEYMHDASQRSCVRAGPAQVRSWAPTHPSHLEQHVSLNLCQRPRAVCVHASQLLPHLAVGGDEREVLELLQEQLLIQLLWWGQQQRCDAR